MKITRWSPVLLLLSLAGTPAGFAQDAPATTIRCENPELIFACKGNAILTQAALDGAFSRIPESDRLMFIRDGALVDKMISSLLQAELIALDAEQAGFAQRPEVEQRMLLAARAELASAWTEELAQQVPEADYAAMAYEDYLANPSKYSSEATVDFTHILIATRDRLPSEAEEIALGVQSRVQEDPAQFDALVMEFSDDPGKAKNGGKYRNMKYSELVKPFAESVFSLQQPGEISGPVESEYGFHLIRLDARQDAVLLPYDEVKEQAMLEMKEKYMADYRSRYLQKLLLAPTVFPEGSVEVMARRYFGDDLEDAPIFTEEGVK